MGRRALLSPNAAWVKRDRWEALTAQGKERPPIAPDFVAELRSRTDTLEDLQQKMQEYIANGVRLCWLLNPQDYQVEIYRLGKAVEVLLAPATLSREKVLPGFVLVLKNLLA